MNAIPELCYGLSNMPYIELHARSAFSFLRGASLPEQLAEVAGQLGLPAMALCDRDGVYGAPRFCTKAKEAGVRPIIGAELTMDDETILPVLVESRLGYQNLCRLVTRSHLRAPKGEGSVTWAELTEFSEGLVALTGDEDGPLLKRPRSAIESAEKLLRIFGQSRVFLELQRHLVRG